MLSSARRERTQTALESTLSSVHLTTTLRVLPFESKSKSKTKAIDTKETPCILTMNCTRSRFRQKRILTSPQETKNGRTVYKRHNLNFAVPPCGTLLHRTHFSPPSLCNLTSKTCIRTRLSPNAGAPDTLRTRLDTFGHNKKISPESHSSGHRRNPWLFALRSLCSLLFRETFGLTVLASLR